MESRKKLNPLQKLFARKPQTSEERLRKFYEKMQKDPKVPLSYKDKSLTPERVASNYLRMFEAGNEFYTGDYIPTLVHEYEIKGEKYCLTARQGILSDYEIAYPATHFLLEKNGDIVKETVVGANYFVNIQIAEFLEYARIMHGEKVYAYLMELVAMGIEGLDDASCYADEDATHRKNQRKLDIFMKLDRVARRIYREVRAINRENDTYEITRKAIDIKNDERRKEFDNVIVVNPERFNSQSTNVPVKEKTDREKDFE